MPEKKKASPLLFDKRVVNRFVKARQLSSEQVKQHLEKLPDLSAQSEDIFPLVYGDKKGHAR